MRRAAKRDDSEAGIVEVLESLGASVFRMDRPCDLLIGYRGQTHLAECKTPGAKATGKKKRATKKYQDDFASGWKGAAVVRLFTPEDAASWLLGLAPHQVREAQRSNPKPIIWDEV